MNRRVFATRLGAFSAQMLAPTSRISAEERDLRVDSAMVLAGGGARGAYEAGVVEGIRRAHDVRDGQPLPGADLVCGASIGSVNAWFVATAQYEALTDLWATIARENIFAIKHQYQATAQASSGVFTRIAEALAMMKGLASNVSGVLDNSAIASWLSRHIDPRAPLVSEFVFTATNLRAQRTDLFYRLPFAPSDVRRLDSERRVRAAVTGAGIRPVRDEELRPALRASTAIPVLFDPVPVPGSGGPELYVDGGVADNTPIDIARALARTVRIVFVDPTKSPEHEYKSALEVGVAAFEIAQRRVLETSLRDARLESEGKRLFAQTAVTAEQKEYFRGILAADLYLIRPAAELPVGVADFSFQGPIDAAYARGVSDGQRGWTPFK